MGICGSKNVARRAHLDIGGAHSPGQPAGSPTPATPRARTASSSVLSGLPRLNRKSRSAASFPQAAADSEAVRFRPVSPATARIAATQIARDACDPNHPLYLDLSAAMCWDAVKHCAVASRLLHPNVDAQHDLVSPADAHIRGRAEVEALPEGHAVGFFDGPRLVHVMLSLGNGAAAGNKNDCIGIGAPVGWETLNLNHLNWNENGCVTAPGLHQAERSLVVRSRLLGGPKR